MLKKWHIGFFVVSMLGALPACNNSKIPCPTYADSFPEKKKKKKPEPQMPKAGKAKSGIMPGGKPSHHVQ